MLFLGADVIIEVLETRGNGSECWVQTREDPIVIILCRRWETAHVWTLDSVWLEIGWCWDLDMFAIKQSLFVLVKVGKGAASSLITQVS